MIRLKNRKIIFVILALIAFGQRAWAQSYITDVMVIGDPDQREASDLYDSFESQGWTGINRNLNSGTDDGYYIYLMYKTESSSHSSGTPITDLYLRVSDSNDAPDEFTLDGRNYRLSNRSGLHMLDSKGDLNCGAGGKYIHLYYTKDAFSPGRIITSIAIDNTSNSTAVCENGGTSPCDLNKGTEGDHIYLHVNKDMTGDVAVVHNEAELRDALTLNNANIRLGNYIYVGSSLVIEHNRTQTIDLNGYTLDRDLRDRVNNGEVFNVISGSTLNLSNGTVTGGYGDDGGAIQNKGITNLTGVTITGNTANDRGGGIGNKNGGTLNMTNCTISNNYCNDKTDPRGGGGLFNAQGATATLTNVTITGNAVAQYGGSGICNYGTLTLDGGTITGNSAKSDGGGIWTNGTLNLQGAITITGNTITNGQLSNLYLKSGKVVTVTGSLAGSNIGIYMLTQGTFTNGYSTYHSGTHPNTIFTSDQNSNVSIDINSQEAQIDLFYIDRDWDDWDRVVTKTTRTLAADQYTVLNGGGDINLNPGYYVVKGNVTYDFIYMDNGGDHHLILCDGATLNAKHINVEESNTLHIYGQIKDIGKIVVKDMDGSIVHAGIGGRGVNTGTIVIHGGYVQAQGGYEAHFTYNYGGAGIGGGRDGNGGTIIILGGTVVAYSYGEDGAGIGGGYDGNGGNVTIHGGNVTAQGGLKGAGIGSGHNSNEIITSSGSLTVTGGEVYAYGGAGAAGIGGGYDFSGGDVTITGGYVYAKGGGNAAGIGSGCEYTFSDRVDGGWLTVSGGRVEAYGGADGAGIGGGEDADCDHVTITGGYVYAEGNDYGAGIGGGERGKGGYVTINGGTVIAKAGARAPRAIGAGDDNEINGSLTFGNEMMVSSERKANADEREDMCWNRTQVRVEPCTHEDAGSYTSNGDYVYFWDCPHCGKDHGTAPYTFLTAGNWHDNTNWLGNEIAFINSDVIVKAAATITNGRVVDVGNITLKDGGSITISDGCQLYHNNTGVKATVQKEITSWTDVKDNYYLMALPFTSYTADNSPLVVNAPGKYDLYTFDGSKRHREWRQHLKTIANGQGFLYADSIPDTDSRTLSMTGTLVPGNTAMSVDLAYDDATFGGWNLVGNPFACNTTTNFDDFYVIDGTELAPASGTVGPLQGIFVRSTGSGQSVTFTPGNQSKAAQALNIRLAKADSSDAGIFDRARIRFDESEGLEKFMLNPNHTKIYIPQDGKDYAVVNVDNQMGEIPVNFKAENDGRYTLNIDAEKISFSYLHLVDNMTGADVDLLAHSAPEPVEGPNVSGTGPSTSSGTSYTFTAKTTDYENRFKLVFASVCEDADGDNETFAFNSNGHWIISNPSTGSGSATLQVIDINGRILSSESINGSVSKAIDVAPGVYILKLNDKVQKIVIR
jgi:hypothetical protein